MPSSAGAEHQQLTICINGVFEVKTSLGALSKNVVGIELDWRVTLVRVKSARVTAIWIGDRYMRLIKLFISMTKQFKRVIFNTLFHIIGYMCVDRGTYYKRYFEN